jgi:hypothetical protein
VRVSQIDLQGPLVNVGLDNDLEAYFFQRRGHVLSIVRGVGKHRCALVVRISDYERHPSLGLTGPDAERD